MVKPSFFNAVCLLAIVTIICFQFFILIHPLRSTTLVMTERHDPASFASLSGPRLVWLMTFPNSGTSFTINMFRAYANETTATNYGYEHSRGVGFSVPIFHSAEYINGPFLSESKKRPVGKLMLTKTHCGGYCSHCRPDRYVETLQSFQEACLTGRRGFTYPDGTVKILKSQYDPILVEKSIHMFRDPFDNIISRFHLFQKREKKGSGGDGESPSFEDNATGFQMWCKEVDEKYSSDVMRDIGEDTLKILMEASVPCYTDFYRYIQWHNLAFGVVRNLNLPSLIVYYEDYGVNFEKTKDDIISFMESKEIGEKGRRKVSFNAKSYRHFFTEKQQKAVEKYISFMSSEDTNLALRRYLPLHQHHSKSDKPKVVRL